MGEQERKACLGACREPETDREAQRRVCHPQRLVPAGPPAEATDEVERLRARVRRLKAEAGQLKMDLHDLAEGLPEGLERLTELAERTALKYGELMEAQRLLAHLEQQWSAGYAGSAPPA